MSPTVYWLYVSFGLICFTSLILTHIFTLTFFFTKWLQPGEFIHSMGDSHVYLNHVEPLQEQLKRTPRPFPTLRIKRQVANIDDFVSDDFELIGYNPHPKLSMQMAV